MAKKPMNVESVQRERARILEQAQQLIEDDGLGGLTMRRLASQLGVTATTIYRYFTSKDDLYLTILVAGYDRLYTRMEKRIRQCSGMRERLEGAIDEYVRFGLENPGYYNIMFNYRLRYDQCVNQREAASVLEGQRIASSLAMLFLSIMEQESIDSKKDPRELFIKTWIILHGYISLYNSGALQNAVKDSESIRASLTQTIMSILLE